MHYQRLLKTGDPLGIRPGRWEGYERPECSVPSCRRPAHARGLCTIHGPRWRRHGDPEAGRRMESSGALLDRFWANVVFPEDEDGCWLWALEPTTPGYPQMSFDGEMVAVHRLAHELLIGPIPEGCDVHHDCEVRRCVRPSHLMALTRKGHAARHRELRAMKRSSS